MFALSPLTGWLADRLGRIPTIGIGLGVLAIAMTLAALAPDDAHSLTGLALFLLGLGWSACLVAGSTLLSRSVPEDIRTSAQGLSDLTMGALASIAGIASGPILAYFGFHWLAIVCGLLLIPVALLAATQTVTPDPRACGTRWSTQLWSSDVSIADGGIPSPNIWHHPKVYEVENRAVDPDGVIEPAHAGDPGLGRGDGARHRVRDRVPPADVRGDRGPGHRRRAPWRAGRGGASAVPRLWRTSRCGRVRRNGCRCRIRRST